MVWTKLERQERGQGEDERKPTTVKLTICVDCGIIMEDPALFRDTVGWPLARLAGDMENGR